MTNGATDSGFLRARYDLAAALGGFMQDLGPHISSHLVAACVYELPPDAEDQAVIIANAHGPQATYENHHFFARHLANRRIEIPGTTVGESLSQGKKAVFLASGYRADHFCLNLLDGRNGSPDVTQLVFKAHDFDSPFSAQELAALSKHVPQIYEGSRLQQMTRVFNGRHHNDIPAYIPPDTAPDRDMFFMYCDISGSSRIAAEAGFPLSYEFNAAIRDQVMRAQVARFRGEALRSEGDGLWVVFPTTGLSEAERSRFLHQKVIPAAEAVIASYNSYKTQFISQAVRESYMKVGISYSTLSLVKEQSRYFSYGYDGEALSRLRYLAESLAPRDRDIVIFDDAVGPLSAAISKDIIAIDAVKIAPVKGSGVNKAFLYEPKA